MATVDAFATSAPSLPCNFTVTTDCCDSWSEYTTELQTAAAEFGALVMWAATGRRYGLCERTARPCGRTCGGNTAGMYWSEGTWIPYIFNGVWRNCAGCTGGCTCAPGCQVYLPGPVASIPVTGVSQDGETVPEASWRVDNGQWLVRTDGECWPLCQDYNADSGAGVFTVTYFQGLPVPGPVARAAGELACEYAKACIGAECRLPSRIQSLTRQGMTVSMVDVDLLLEKGLTGITTVDQIIRAVNPYGLVSQMKISSPDLPVTRYTNF